MDEVFRGALLMVVLAVVHVVDGGAAQNFFVSPGGSDSNPGTFEAPWCTLQKAADSATPGSTVNILAGTYRERVTIHVSGSAEEGPIVFRAAGAGRVLLDGTGMAAPVGTSALLWIANQHDLVFDGLEIAHYQTAVKNNVVAGVYATGTGSNITLRHLLVHDIRHTGTTVNGTDAHAIGFFGTNTTTPMTGIVVEACEIRDCVLGSSEAVVFNGNVDGFRAERNLIHDCNNIGLLAVGWEGTAPSNDQARNGVIADNLVFNITSYGNPAYGTDRSAAGIYCDGCRDSVFERNMVYQTDLGIEVGNEHSGRTTSNVIVRDNISYFNNVCGLAFGGYSTTRGIVQNCTFINNTFYRNDTTASGTGEISIQKGHHNLITQNIIAPTEQAIAYTNYFGAAYSYSNTTSFNDIYAPGGVASLFTWQNKDYLGLAALQAATGQEQNSIGTDPQFALPAAVPPDLHLMAGSAAVNRGDPAFVPGATETDADRRTRLIDGRVDIGGFELPVCPPALPADPIALVLSGKNSGSAQLDWIPVANATGYDLTNGSLAQLLSTQGDFSQAMRTCLVRQTPLTTREVRENPLEVPGYWYLVRGGNYIGPGTYDDNTPGQIGSRDAEMAASPFACP